MVAGFEAWVLWAAGVGALMVGVGGRIWNPGAGGHVG